MAQLPSFIISDDETKMPITEEYLKNLCARFLDPHSLEVLKNLFIEPPKTKVSTGSKFVDAWYQNERDLRIALAQIRALKMNKKCEFEGVAVPSDIMNIARTAINLNNPLASEQYLNKCRIELIENIEPTDNFSLDAVYAYALKLKLTTRMKKFNAEKGMASYHKIYERILNSDALGENK